MIIIIYYIYIYILHRIYAQKIIGPVSPKTRSLKNTRATSIFQDLEPWMRKSLLELWCMYLGSHKYA